MTLVINIGNSSISAGLHGAGGWTEHRRYSTDEKKTADEYLVLFKASFGEGTLRSADRATVSTVVPELEKTFEDCNAGLTESMVSRMKQELLSPVTVIATGGQASVLAGLVSCFDVVDPWITLDGIRLIAEREGDGQ